MFTDRDFDRNNDYSAKLSSVSFSRQNNLGSSCLISIKILTTIVTVNLMIILI